MCNYFCKFGGSKLASDACTEGLIGSKELADTNETVSPETV
jgi:hypothetical protein